MYIKDSQPQGPNESNDSFLLSSETYRFNKIQMFEKVLTYLRSR